MTQPGYPTPDPLPPPPPPKPAEMTWRQREELFARWNAAEEEQRATDSMREHSRYGRETDADRRRLHAAEQAWDYVRGAS